MGTQMPSAGKEAKGANRLAAEVGEPITAPQNWDGLSRRILALLQESGRRSFSSVARELGVSEGSVRSRVAHLEAHEHLRFIAVLDPVHADGFCWAMLGIKVVSGISPHALALEFADHSSAIWVGVVGGEFDLLIETWTETPAKLQAFLEATCHASDKVKSVETMVGMSIYKWGAPEL